MVVVWRPAPKHRPVSQEETLVQSAVQRPMPGIPLSLLFLLFLRSITKMQCGECSGVLEEGHSEEVRAEPPPPIFAIAVH